VAERWADKDFDFSLFHRLFFSFSKPPLILILIFSAQYKPRQTHILLKNTHVDLVEFKVKCIRVGSFEFLRNYIITKNNQYMPNEEV
jgi:hypothetical protein